MVIAAFDVLTSTDCPHGFALLKTIRKFVELDAYVGFDLHTEDTLAAFEECLLEFQDLLDVSILTFDLTALILFSFQAYIAVAQNYAETAGKSWEFAKVHTHQHLPQDVRNKGVQKHMTTRISERFFGALRKWYRTRSNFKNVTDMVRNVM